MDANPIVANVDFAEFGREFVEQYLSRGLGVMSKREIDVLVLHLLEEHGALDLKSNHALSLGLQLTEARVRSLRYEARLRYPPTEASFVERRFLYVLTRAQFEAESGKIVFAIEDSYLRNAILARLKSKGAFADTSFNTELVRVSPDRLAPVLEELYSEKLASDFVQAMKQAVNSAGFAKVRGTFVLGAAKALGSGAVTAIKTLLGGA